MATSIEQVTYNAPDGATMGRGITEKISFYGVTPVAQYAAVGTASTYLTTTNTTSVFGFTSLADLTSLILQVSTITQAGRSLGLWA